MAATAGLLIARAALAAVFFVAGASKLSDRAGSRATLVGFGFPPALASGLGVALPVAELVVAMALLPAATANWGAFGALVLLGSFIAGIVHLLVRGRKADCHCFGQLHSSPVGRATLARNVVLALVAGFVLVGGRGRVSPSYLDWFGGLAALEWVALLSAVVALGVLAVGGWFGLHLMRQHGRILLRLDAMERTLAELLARRLPVILVFANPACAPCTAMLPDVAGWQRGHGSRLTVALISQGTLEENRVRFEATGIRHVLVQRAREISDAYGASLVSFDVH